MKKTIHHLAAVFLIGCSLPSFTQVQMDKTIQLTGSDGNRMLTNLESPVNGTDAVNKAYVDAAIAASGSGAPTMISNESASAMNYGDAIRYCKNLSESSYNDWRMPGHKELLDIISKGGTTVSSDASANYIWFQMYPAGGNISYGWSSMRLSDGDIGYSYIDNLTATFRVRCVR